jgi:HAE1 family hydrophobic/amphiphilic exporter-1
VLETIWRFIEEKQRAPVEAAVEATREIGLAVLATTLSLVAIFIPVAFMGGIVGRFMKSFGMTMAFAVLVSMLVSFTLTPMMSARWLKRRADGAPGHGSKESRLFAPIEAAYLALLRWAMLRRWTVVATAALVLSSTVPLFVLADKTFLPEDDQAEFEISARAPEGTSLESTELIANRLAAQVRSEAPEVDYTLVTVADDPARTANLLTVYVRLKPLDQRTRSQFEVMNDVRSNVLPRFAAEQLRTRVQPVAAFGGGGSQNATLQFVIKGPDLKVLADAATRIASEAKQQPSLVDVDTSLNLGRPEVSVEVDRFKAADLGVQIADAANALRLLVGGDQITTYYEGGEQYEVHLRAQAAHRTTTAAIGNLTVPSDRLGSVPLDYVASFTNSASTSEINRLGRQRQVTVFANVPAGESQTPGMAAIEEAFDRIDLGPSYQAAYTGRSRELGRAAQNFLLAFVLSLVFMYLILAAQFESWLHPVTILLSLPLTIPFALLSIIVTGQSLNIFSALGLLVLFGVVKKNSILQIDHAIQLRETGMPRDEAVVQASRDRLRPILMTTLAFVAGMIPLVLSSGIGAGTNRAIGFVIIGGQSLVLVLTLIVTPVAYSLLDDASRLQLLSRIRRFVPSRAAATAGGLLMALLAGTSARAQSPAVLPSAPASAPAAQPAGQRATEAADTLQLTLAEAVRRAVENNADLAVVRLEPEANVFALAQAQSAFTPMLSTTFGHVNTTNPPTNLFSGESGVENTNWFGSGTARQRLNVGGGTWLVSWDAARTGSNSPITSFDPGLQSNLLLAFSQPLLRDRTIDAARQQLIITRRNQDISELQFKQAVVQTVAAVKTGYWALKATHANVAVQQRSLELAQELARQNKARVDVGQLPPLDLVAAEAEVAQRREQLIVARTADRDAEDRLRRLIMNPRDAPFWRTRLEPIDEPQAGAPAPDVDAAIRATVEGRLDIQQARKAIENAATGIEYFTNQRLPDLRLEASYSPTGLGGTRLLRSGFPGTVIGTQDTSFASTLQQVLTGDYPSWSIGVTVIYPIGRSYEEAGLARAQVERKQAEARVAGLEVAAIEQVRIAARQVESTAERIEATRAGAELAQQRLEAEQKRYEVGMSTSFLVTQALRDLVQAQVALLQATLDYQSALVGFEALQQVPQMSGATTLGLSGSTVFALPPPVPQGVSPAGSAAVF